MKSIAYTEAAQIRLGPSPRKGMPIASGSFMANMLGAAIVVPSKAHRADYTIERHGIRVRMRMWWRGAESPIWYSPGYHEVTALRFVGIWIRAAFARRRRDRAMPRASVVR